MIKNVKLKFGRALNVEQTIVNTLPITVFVGPNNSGKSQILREIHQFCVSGDQNSNNKIIDNIQLAAVSDDQIENVINKLKLEPAFNEVIHNDHILLGRNGERQQVHLTSYKMALVNPTQNLYQFCTSYLRYNTLILNGNNRINMVNAQGAGNLQDPAHSSFQMLFRNNEKRYEVRRIIYEAFEKYLVIDPTNLGQLSLRLSKKSPENELEERGIHEAAVNFHKNAEPIDYASDGVKAFTGMVIEMVAGDPSVLLMDEPEAFLHPSLAFKLGKEVAGIMSHSEKRLFVATHSPNFIMGCIQSGTPVNIVRLTYRDEVATSRILPNDDILTLMRNPLLRSVGVLSALFYEFVIVTESDADRAFYQEINDRLLKFSDKGIPNCLFLNAQNKQTVKTIIKPLRSLGIPVAGIVDIDILKEGGSVWADFLDSASFPEIEKQALAHTRQAINKKFTDSGKNMKKDGGINILDGQDKEALSNLFEKLAEYGLFVVPNGELESWLNRLNVRGHGPNWLIEIFEKMGEDPYTSEYIKPEDEDVWGFIEKIGHWFLNQARKGIPN
ncbi:ATP-dependent nuclease [Acinetobacter sp. WCHAc060025]|uniref:ATP-dependent nuclease n=1 Tax=Acinetobacter sp. WCHAc060025 TaxID=2518625 RepID=UPI001022C6BA|nr:AAA family ATPase [Acinetobacter sp. WCHAc060025]RZG75453.1 ATP-binding protein [Acinetobacter sp. WCHAc060025]